MKSMVRKTKDNSGATIIMALLFMLICVTVSTVLLAAAGTVSRDSRRQREQQQAYLTVSSAVNFINHDICSWRFLRDAAPPVVVTDEGSTATFSSFLNAALQSDRSEKDYETDPLHISVDGVSDLDVEAKLTISDDGMITVTCTAYSDEKETEKAYQMTAKLRKTEYEADANYDTWELSSVSKGK